MNRVSAACLLAMLGASLVLAGDLKSGPQPGKGVSSFYPYNVFNSESPGKNGKENCLV
jgi:hypothetical protein